MKLKRILFVVLLMLTMTELFVGSQKVEENEIAKEYRQLKKNVVTGLFSGIDAQQAEKLSDTFQKVANIVGEDKVPQPLLKGQSEHSPGTMNKHGTIQEVEEEEKDLEDMREQEYNREVAEQRKKSHEKKDEASAKKTIKDAQERDMQKLKAGEERRKEKEVEAEREKEAKKKQDEKAQELKEKELNRFVAGGKIDATKDAFDEHSKTISLDLRLKDLQDVNSLRFLEQEDDTTSTFDKTRNSKSGVGLDLSVPIKGVDVGVNLGAGGSNNYKRAGDKSTSYYSKKFVYITKKTDMTKDMEFYKGLQDSLELSLKKEELFKFFDDYGTHYLCKVSAGGHVSITFKEVGRNGCTKNSVSNSFNFELKASMAGDEGPKGDFKTKSNSENADNSCFTKAKQNAGVDVTGGDQNIIFDVNQLMDSKTREKWMDSVHANPQVLETTYCTMADLPKLHSQRKHVKSKLREYMLRCGGLRCSNRGTCKLPEDKCECDQGFSGKHCQLSCSEFHDAKKFQNVWKFPNIDREQNVVLSPRGRHQECLSTEFSSSERDQSEATWQKIADEFCRTQIVEDNSKLGRQHRQFYDRAVKGLYKGFEIANADFDSTPREFDNYCKPQRIGDMSIIEPTNAYNYFCTMWCGCNKKKREYHENHNCWQKHYAENIKIFKSIYCVVEKCYGGREKKVLSSKNQNMRLDIYVSTGNSKEGVLKSFFGDNSGVKHGIEIQLKGKDSSEKSKKSRWIPLKKKLKPGHSDEFTDIEIPVIEKIKKVRIKLREEDDAWEMRKIEIINVDNDVRYECKEGSSVWIQNGRHLEIPCSRLFDL
eukprot:g7333.t1